MLSFTTLTSLTPLPDLKNKLEKIVKIKNSLLFILYLSCLKENKSWFDDDISESALYLNSHLKCHLPS